MFEVFADSAANLSKALREEKRIHVLTMNFVLGGVEMDENSCPYDMATYYSLLRRGEACDTSLVNTAAFIRAFRPALERGKDVICLTVSHQVSGTYDAARMAAWELGERYPRRRIEIIDSLVTSLGEGMIALAAAEMRDGGVDTARAAKLLRARVDQMIQMVTVTDLKYLQRTGRLSGSAALIGGALNIKAVLVGNSQGECVVTGRVRGTKKALEFMAERWAAQAVDPAGEIGITHGDNETDARLLLEMLRERGFAGECRMEYCEMVSGAHMGPGLVALFFTGEKREK